MFRRPDGTFCQNAPTSHAESKFETIAPTFIHPVAEIMQSMVWCGMELQKGGDKSVMGGVTKLSPLMARGDKSVTPSTARFYGEKMRFWGVLKGQILHTM